MWKERLKRMVNVTTSVTTGTLIACTIWYGITQFTLGKSLADARIPYLTLPQILSLGILCGVESELIMPNDDRLPKEYWMRYVLHYIMVTVTALICGYFYGWYEPTFSGILLMCITSMGIYMFASYLKYRSGKKEADAMNAYLEKMRRDKEKED